MEQDFEDFDELEDEIDEVVEVEPVDSPAPGTAIGTYHKKESSEEDMVSAVDTLISNLNLPIENIKPSDVLKKLDKIELSD